MSGERALLRPPPRSARRLPWREAQYAALDFETTGLDLERDDVISFGVVRIDDGRIAIQETVYRLALPTVSPSPGSVTVHGLRAQDLQTAPALDETRRVLAEALQGRFLVTWFASVENGFLAKLFGERPRAAAWARRNVDVRGLVLAVGDRAEDERLTLTAAADRYNVPVADPHHALDDALVTAELFLVLATKLASQGRGAVRHLLRAGRGARGPYE